VALPVQDARQAIAGVTSEWLRCYAAFAASDGMVTDCVHLWAGTGYRHATTAPAANILRRLASDL
jgi:hypothetical protein